MVDYDHNVITQGSDSQQILRWEVWFKCPWGINPDLEAVRARCIENDLDPNMIIRPIPVVMGKTLYESF